MTKTNKAPARAPFLTRTPRPEGLPEYFLCTRQSEATKLGLRAHGTLTYQTLLDPDRQRVFLRVVANSGSGSFSDEPVLVDKLAEAVASRDTSKPLRGNVLQTAIVGKSVCNAGFFAAVLVAEGLLGREVGKRFDLTDLQRWKSWTAEQRATPGELAQVRLKPAGVDAKNDKSAAVGKVGQGEGVGHDATTDEGASPMGIPEADDLSESKADDSFSALGDEYEEEGGGKVDASKGRRRTKDRE